MEMKRLNVYIKAFVAIVLTIFLIAFSENVFTAAVDGLNTWWEIVFPALLPFFIMAEILMGLGVVNYIGTLLEPLMRPIFKIPGVGAFALAMGLASGYPIGAKITGNLRRDNLCTKTEGERLIAFVNTADPLFLIGAVAVGMLKRPELGIILALAHYLSCLSVGLIFRFYNGDNSIEDINNNQNYSNHIFKRAADKLYQARKKDERKLGEIMGDSIKESVETLLLIGGYIILFSVITEIFSLLQFEKIISLLLNLPLEFLGFNEKLIMPFISGFFEITNGSHLVSQSIAPLGQKLIVISSIIAWSGISVHAQVAAMIKGTDISLKPYIIARIIHGLTAGFYTYLLYKPAQLSLQNIPAISDANNKILNLQYTSYLRGMLLFMLLILSLSLILSLTIYFFNRLKIF